MAEVKTQDNVEQVVAELRNLVETKSKDSGEYKEKLDKLSVAFENAEKKNAEVIAEMNAKADKAAALEKKLDELETKFYRPTGSSQIKIVSEAEIHFKKALLSRERYDAVVELKQMNEHSMLEAGIETKYLRTDSNVDGGYLCPPEWSKEIAKKMIEISPMRQICRVTTVGSKVFEQPVRNTLAEASYEGEAEAVSDSNSQYGLVEIVNNRLTAKIPVTYEMLNDGHYDIMAEIQSDAAIQFAKKEGYMFLQGNGVKQPYGLMKDTAVPTRNSGIAADINFDNLKLMTGDLKAGYDPTFMLNRRTIAYLATLKNSVGAYLWQEGSTGDGVPSTLCGYPYVRAIDMDDIGAGLYPVIFGDFKEGYQIVDRFGLYVIRDEITKADRAMIQFILHLYNGGKVRLSEAFIKLRCHV
ncbi:MAG: phage major capsid protein [Lutibacter sp.]|jgi:HK97 family phage major capsid protein